MMQVHVHISFIAAVLTFLEFLIAWIPVKMLAACYEGRSALASAVYNVL